MESSFQNSVSDFDLNFLDHAPKKPLILNRVLKRSSVAYLKTKVLLTDSIVHKYNSSKDLLDQTQKSLLESQQECKNICIDYRNCLEKCNILENEILNIQNANKELQDRRFTVQTQYEALQSHINQLQVLITDYETQIETLKIEAKLHKDTILNHERKTNNQKRENEMLRKHIVVFRDVIKNKKKVNKKVRIILDKYKNIKKDLESEAESDSDSGSDHFEDAATTLFSEDSSDTIVIPQTQETTKPNENKFQSIADEDTIIKRITSTDSENNDGRSVDTGRGSSLAFSDGGKSFHSPDYYMDDSPLGSVIITSDKNKSYKDGATSPMLKNKQYRNVSTSPIPTRQAIRDRGTSPIPIHKRTVATSPVIFEKNNVYIIRDTVNTIDRGASPIKVLECFKPNNKRVKECRDVAVDTTSLVCNITTPSRTSAPCEKECLEINNSLTMNEDSRNDSEIQMILGEMKLHEQLITPIPSTPFKSSRARSHHTASNLSNIEESLFDKLGPEGIALTKKLDEVFNMVSSMKEAMPHLFNSQVDVRKLQENTCDSLRVSDANVLKNTVTTISESTQNEISNINEVDLDNESEEQHTSNGDFTNSNSMATVSQSTKNDSLNINGVNSDSEHCNENDEQQISDDDLTTSKIYSESKTDNDNHLEKVVSQQANIIDDVDESDNLMISFDNEPENEQQVKDSNYHDTEFSKKLKYQEEVVDNVNRTIFLPKTRKRRKLTNLEKMRMRLAPKSKISKTVPVRKRRIKPKQLCKNTLLRKKVRDSDTSASLNDKQVYEKAVKVMTELKTKQSERKFLTVVVEDCAKTIDKYANQSSSERNIETQKNTVLDTILNSQAQILKCTTKPTDDSQNACNSVNRTSTEIKRPAKRNTRDAPTETIEIKRTLRPRQQSKSNDYLSEASTYSKKNEEVLNTVETATAADIIDSVQLANKTIGKRKRRRTTSRQDDAALNLNDTTDSEKECNASPAKRITVIEEKNSEPVAANQRILRSSVRQENDDTNSVSSQSNKICSDDSESLFNDNYNVPNKRNIRISRCGMTTRKSSTETKLNINSDKTNLDNIKDKTKLEMIKDKLPATTEREGEVKKVSDEHTKEGAVSYSDLDLFSTDPENIQPHSTGIISTEPVIQPKESLLCLMIAKYGTKSVHFYAKKPLESVTDKIHQKLEDEIEKINELHHDEAKIAMMKLVTEIRHWDIKDFIVGFMKYLKDPNRKTELFTAIVSPPAPPTTKSEQVLLYIISELRYHWENVDLACDILNNMEYHLFCLNRTPDFNTIESMSHFYAVLCRYYRMSSRLRVFILDALYCIQFKAIPLIKQCLDVWMHILPLAHMGIAKTPLVTCLVYLLHFYKCEDRFNRIQDLRMILKRKYFYDFNEWNESKILDMLRMSIKDLRDIPVEIKMLRLALLIISKRQGPKWCLKNIITGILQPIIEKNNVSDRVKLFCISMLGPLLKPFPNDMKVHCEVVVNKLMDMLDLPQSQETLEAIYSSLIHISKHNEVRLHKYLLKWNPPKISPEFEAVLQDYVKSRPIKVWKYALRNCYSSF